MYLFNRNHSHNFKAGNEDRTLPAKPGHSVNNNMPEYAPPAEPVLQFSCQISWYCELEDNQIFCISSQGVVGARLELVAPAVSQARKMDWY